MMMVATALGAKESFKSRHFPRSARAVMNENREEGPVVVDL